MAHGDLAQTAALLGAAGSVCVLAARGRAPLFVGFALLAAAEAALAVALVPRSDLSRLDSPLRVGALVVVTLTVVALGWALSRFPAVVPVLLLAAAPFRIPVDLGHQHAFLLIPLYGVLAAASIALLVRAGRGPVPEVLPLLAVPAAALIGFYALSLLWAQDLQQGSIELTFFVFPFAALVAVVARAPYADWLPRVLGVTLVGLACVFAVVGIWQEWTKTVFFAHDLRVANTYASFFRVTSVFKDPSIYGRHLAVAIVVLVVVLWLGRVRFWPAAAVVALIFSGLYFSYSQSSMAVLFVGVLVSTLVLGDGRARKIVLVAALVAALAGGVAAATTARGHSLRKATSGRSRLVTVTTRVIENHPFVGVGVGSQPLASSKEAKSRLAARRDASHTTPLTVLAELGVVGFVLYLTFLAAAVRLLFLTARRHRAFGLGLAGAFLVLFLHSLFYSGFFEDPLMWGSLAAAAASLAVASAMADRDQSGPISATNTTGRRPGTRRRGRGQLMRLARRALVLATAALACGPVSGASTTAHSRPVPILMYHVIAPPIAGAPFPALYVPKGEFAAQIRWLARNGYRAVTLGRVYDHWRDGRPLPRRPIVLTFDDGYRSDYLNALPVLRSHHWPGVLNLEVRNERHSWGLSPVRIRALIAAGWELDSHTINHPDLTTLGPAQLQTEVAESRRLLRRQFHVPVDFFCYPSGRYDDAVVAAVQAAGYLGATSTRYGLARPGDIWTLARVRVNGGEGAAGLAAKLKALGS